MSADFFKKTKVDTDEVASIASDLDDMISAADTFKDEIESYKDDLSRIHDDLEDCDDAEELARCAKRLRELSVPEGYENPDGTPDGIADAIDELESSESQYDAWKEEFANGIAAVRRAIQSVAVGKVLPTQRAGAYEVRGEGESKPRVARPGQEQDQWTTLPYSAETDAWTKSLQAVCDKAAAERFPGDLSDATVVANRGALSMALVTQFRELAVTLSAYRHPGGSLIVPNDQPMLSLMWVVTDLLQGVSFHLGNQSRVIVTSATEMQSMARVVEHLHSVYHEGVEQIDESVAEVS